MRRMLGILVILAGVSPVEAAKYVQNEVLVKFTSSVESHESWVREFRNSGSKVEHIYKIVPGLARVSLAPGDDVKEALKRLKGLKSVVYAEPNYIRRIAVTETPQGYPRMRTKNPEFPEKPGPLPGWDTDPRQQSNYGTSQNFTNRVWGKYGAIGDAKTIIAVVDTGVDYTHRDLAGNMWRNPGESGTDSEGRNRESNGIDDDMNGFVDDLMGWDYTDKDNKPYDDLFHGTHVAGIAAAVGGNGHGISGQCPRCSIMALKFIDESGWGTDADAISSLEYAMANGAQVINSSWGGLGYSQAMFDAFKATSDAGIINVVAAGNDGRDLQEYNFYPAKFKFPGMVTVAALYEVNILIPIWSNFGSKHVHLSSGGYRVYSTFPDGEFGEASGTSMASPNVAGCAALIKSFRPGLTHEEVVNLMRRNVQGDKGSMSKTIFRGRPHMEKIFKELTEDPQTH